MAAAEDEEVQKRGVVFICYRTDPAFSSSSTGFDPVSGTRNGQLTQGLPIRIVSFHFCFDSSKFLVSLSHVMNAFNTDMQARVKVHQGKSFLSKSDQELPTHSWANDPMTVFSC